MPTRSSDCARSGPALGAKVEIMTPDHHDLVLAITSHLPHLIAYTIVGTADELEGVTQSEVLKFSAGGFRDFTRIAASDPTMWRDVFLTNKDAVLEMLGTFNEDLVQAHPRDPPRRRRGAVRAFHPHPRHPPRHRRDRPGFRRARFRPPARAAGEATQYGLAHQPRSLCGKREIRRALQNSGGVCATFSGPRNTAPSTKRSGKARAFLPSSDGFLAERVDAGGDADVGVLLAPPCRDRESRGPARRAGC